MITLEGWVDIMYNLMDAGNPVVAIAFCVLIVAICSWFLLNIILAVLSEGIESVDDEDQSANEILVKTAKSIKRARLQKEKKFGKSLDKSLDESKSKNKSALSPSASF